MSLYRWLRIGLAWAGATLLALIGLAVWTRRRLASTVLADLTYLEMTQFDQAMKGLALGLAAAGLGVFLWLVADDLCDQTPAPLRRFLSVFTGVTAAGAIVWTLWTLWHTPV